MGYSPWDHKDLAKTSDLARSKPIALQRVVHSAICWIKCKTGLIFLSREGCFQAAGKSHPGHVPEFGCTLLWM